MGKLVSAPHPPNDVNGQWTAAFSAIEGDEPSLTAVAATHIKASLVNHTESSVIFLLVENAILQKIVNLIMVTNMSYTIEAKVITS